MLGLPAALGRHLDLGRLPATARSATSRSTSRWRTSRRWCSPTATPTTASTSTASTSCCATGSSVEGLPVYAPEGLEKFLLALVADWGNVFDWNAVGDGDAARIGDIDLRFSRTDHPPPTYAVEATARGPAPDLHRRHRPRLDASARSPPAPTSCSRRPPTSTTTSRPRSTCRPSRPARPRGRPSAQRLILTHLWPRIDKLAAIEEGGEAFGSGVTLATQGLVTTI